MEISLCLKYFNQDVQDILSMYSALHQLFMLSWYCRTLLISTLYFLCDTLHARGTDYILTAPLLKQPAVAIYIYKYFKSLFFDGQNQFLSYVHGTTNAQMDCLHTLTFFWFQVWSLYANFLQDDNIVWSILNTI